MRSLRAALLLLALAGCAHGSQGTSAHLGARPHAPLSLTGIQGVTDEQAPLLEDSLCQALVEANHGDVSCPSARRAALDLARMRTMTSGDSTIADQAVEAVTAEEARVDAVVSRAGEQWVLQLQFLPKGATAAEAKQTLSAGSYEDLVQRAPAAAKALLE